MKIIGVIALKITNITPNCKLDFNMTDYNYFPCMEMYSYMTYVCVKKNVHHIKIRLLKTIGYVCFNLLQTKR